MKRLIARGALAVAASLVIATLPVLSAYADNDDWHHDNGRHRGWYKHHGDDDDDFRGYYGPRPVYVVPPPAPVYVTPPPVYYAPAPVYAAPSFNLVVPLRVR